MSPEPVDYPGLEWNLTYSVNCTDLNGNGIFDYGDFFIVTAASSEPFPPTERTNYIQLAWTDRIMYFDWLFSFEVQDGQMVVQNLTDYDRLRA